MTRTHEQVKAEVFAKVQSQGPEQAAAVYSAMRIEVLKNKNEDLRSVMVMAGDALEEMIGEEAFDAVMDRADAFIYGE